MSASLSLDRGGLADALSSRFWREAPTLSVLLLLLVSGWLDSNWLPMLAAVIAWQSVFLTWGQMWHAAGGDLPATGV